MVVGIDFLQKNEYKRALRVVARSFNKLDAPDYSAYGRRSFFAYASYANFCYRQLNNHLSFAAKVDGKLAGMLELRRQNHISMLFVDPEYTKLGCGRALIERAVEFVKTNNTFCARITVNASPYALAFYKKLGFLSTARLQDEDGFVYTPMALALDEYKFAAPTD